MPSRGREEKANGPIDTASDGLSVDIGASVGSATHLAPLEASRRDYLNGNTDSETDRCLDQDGDCSWGRYRLALER